MPTVARVYQQVLLLLGLPVLAAGLLQWRTSNGIQFAAYLVLTVLASGMKVGWQTRHGQISMSFFFVLLGMLQFSPSESYLMGAMAALAGAMAHAPRQHRGYSAVVSICTMTIAILLGQYALRSLLFEHTLANYVAQLVGGGVMFFLGHTFPPAAVSALVRGERVYRYWRDTSFWMVPYYVTGSFLGGALASASSYLGDYGWRIVVLALPVVYLVLRTYKLYIDRVADGVRHAESISSLHLRTIEALALAIDAKDQTTGGHLARVQVYAMALAEELGLSDDEKQALRAASVLHDIGKLAVPEHIISKPGKLTPEEFEKMKIHPIVGAEILERVEFPYPVVPIVRSHHEKWNGTGYPDGLRGEEIPIGARILAAVDCLDALASDRQYRKALPLDKAMEIVQKESGTSYDPRVVEVLARRYRELEEQAGAHHVEPLKLSTDIKVSRGLAPGAGFAEPVAEAASAGLPAAPVEFLGKIAAAREEAQALYELAQTLGTSLSLDETLSVLAVRLKRLVPHDALAVYLRRDNRLLPEFVTGDNFRLFASLEIPLGQGLSGWVAETGKPIVNGNPSVEPGYLNDPTRFSTLRSALAVPLEGVTGVIGVLALYHGTRDCYSRDHLRIVQAITSKLAMAVENALRFRQAEVSASNDYLTGLPNARSLFLHLDAELARCRRSAESLAVVACDLDGFRKIAERYGQRESDKVIQAVAQCLRDGCRDYDYLARMGGEEFVLVLPGLRPEDQAARLDRLRRGVQETLRALLGMHSIAVNLGAAAFPDDGLDAEDLLAEADKRMYKERQAARLLFRDDPTPAQPWTALPPVTHRIQ